MNSLWTASVDQVVAEVLDRADVRTPPVDTLYIARRLGIQLVSDTHQGTRARQKRLGNQSLFLLRPEERLERLQWAVAHELGESFAHRVAQIAGGLTEEDDAPSREHLADRFASRLLLPQGWFERDAEQCQMDLPALKEIYRTASHESIAWRMLDSDQPTVITVFDQGRISTRRANSGFSRPRLLPGEHQVWRSAHEQNRGQLCSHGGLQFQCWPIHEPHWKREILRLTVPDCLELTTEEVRDQAGCTSWES